MPKFAIKTLEGKYLRLPPEAQAVNREVLRIGAEIKSTPYNYGTRAAAEAALEQITAFLKRNSPTPAQRQSTPSEWRYHKYIDRQVGAEIVEI